ncbi:hypothetical protein DSM106972_067260 [Dulcicalothrix desertica PCC 7102]|uniref:Tetratricopeptide repeat protein n=1 Tax=Dulcicalothrix desertica PCC 7102 TaxID=232991 RepID=A0A433V6E3_9CYAN|nr:hypothetical protein [Dulcicalothrix desertica]RUT01629.1 hypothetical protein DSM106972_067260 [Dulcicalothrix desertica PCC 7102]
MPFWNRREMLLTSLIVISNPIGYVFGMFLLGALGGIYLLLAPPKKDIEPPKPEQLKTAIDNAKWGYQVMEADLLGIRDSRSERYKANCRKALPYFKKAISLDSNLGLAYQGQGMSLICQNSYLSGRQSLKHAKSLYLQQGKNRDAKEIDLILKLKK